MPIHRHHAYSTEPFLDALDKLYEDVWVSRAILVCLNEADAENYTTLLNRRAYSAKCLTQDAMGWEWFHQCPNRILVVPLETFNTPSEYPPWENASWNLLLSVDVPSYKMDVIHQNILDAHPRGFGSEHAEFHHLWYLH